MTRNTATIVRPKQMNNLSNCENGIKMFSAMADVNLKATTLLWKPWFMWECLQHQETSLTVTGDLIIGFLLPACT